MNRRFRAILSLVLVLCLLTGIGGVVCAADAGDGGGSQNDPEFTIGGSSGSSSGSSERSYRVIVDDSQKDLLLPSRKSAPAGATVTIRIPEGVNASDIKVLDKDGKEVELTKVDDSTYTFVMPRSDVNVSGTTEDLRLNADDHFAYIEGYPDGTFKPNASVTRAEFCAMASRFFSLKEGSVKFTDVPASFWGYGYIASVVARGYLDDSETAYNPNGAITRAEVVSMVNRMLSRSADEAFLTKGAENLKRFTDVKEADACYLDVMEAANAHDFTVSNKTEVWKNLK